MAGGGKKMVSAELISGVIRDCFYPGAVIVVLPDPIAAPIIRKYPLSQQTFEL